MRPDMKTTIGGLILAVGQLLIFFPYAWAPAASAIVSALGAAILGKTAKDATGSPSIR